MYLPRPSIISTPAVIFFSLASFLPACGGGGSSGGAKSASSDHPMVGSPAPDFNLPAQHGGERASLGAARGKVAIVDFWATWCEPCRASFPKYEALTKKYGDDVVVIGISEDDDPDGIEAFAEETGATFTLAWDEDKSVASAYEPDAMPTSFMVDRNGLVRFIHEGFHNGDESTIESQLQELIGK